MSLKKLLGLLKSRLAAPVAPRIKGPFRGPRILALGQSWWSENERVELRLDRTGTLSILHDGKVVWTPMTATRATSLVMQIDGQLTLYKTHDRLWSVGTGNRPHAELVLQDDGNVVLYDHTKPVWFSGTHL